MALGWARERFSWASAGIFPGGGKKLFLPLEGLRKFQGGAKKISKLIRR
jgi:hypothetical protein